jgi:hypothetical protein
MKDDAAKLFDFSGAAGEPWKLFGHPGPLPIANSCFMVHQGHLLPLPGIEDKIWTTAASFRWTTDNRWTKEN